MDIIDYIISFSILAFVSAAMVKLDHASINAIQKQHRSLKRHQLLTEMSASEVISSTCAVSTFASKLSSSNCSATGKTLYALLIP